MKAGKTTNDSYGLDPRRALNAARGSPCFSIRSPRAHSLHVHHPVASLQSGNCCVSDEEQCWVLHNLNRSQRGSPLPGCATSRHQWSGAYRRGVRGWQAGLGVFVLGSRWRAMQTSRPASPPGHHSIVVPLVAGRGGGAGGLRHRRWPQSLRHPCNTARRAHLDDRAAALTRISRDLTGTIA